MRILLLGAEGQLGCELKEQLEKQLPADSELKACGRKQVDLLDHASIKATIRKFKPGCIINAAAYTAVDKAESEPELAFKINAEAVAIIAEEAKKHNALLIHYSTDYVFDGRKAEPYDEQDKTNPVNVYGQSKLAGEDAIQNTGCSYIIFRTSWVIGKHGNNFAKTILRLAQERDSLSVINDQHGVPTTTRLISRVSRLAIESLVAAKPWTPGIYNLTPGGETTWYGVATSLLQLAEDNQLELNIKTTAIAPITSDQYPTPAARPKNSLLNINKLEQQLGFTLPDWREELLNVAKDIVQKHKLEEGEAA